MSNVTGLLIAGLLIPFLSVLEAGPLAAGGHEVTVVLHAGNHDRIDVPVSVLVDAPDARSAWMVTSEGQFERAGIMDPGLGHEPGPGSGRKELFFAVTNLPKGGVQELVAKLSPDPVEHRTYVWTGEPRQSRRLACSPCHQGLALPSAADLRAESEAMAATGKPPPLPVFKPLPSSQGKDFRWHPTLHRFLHSACYECHGREFIEYRFGQALASNSRWAPEMAPGSETAYPSVYYRVFREKGDRPFAMAAGASAGALPPGLHFGTGSGMRQQHERILSEDANKFVGRQCVRINWVDGEGRVRYHEDRQLTVKNMRASNRSYALWIDWLSELRPAGVVEQANASRQAGWRFQFPADRADLVVQRAGEGWAAATFTSEGHRQTAVCLFPLNGSAAPRIADATNEIGFDLPLSLFASVHLMHCRMWIQGGDPSDQEIARLAADFRDPVQVEILSQTAPAAAASVLPGSD